MRDVWWDSRGVSCRTTAPTAKVAVSIRSPIFFRLLYPLPTFGRSCEDIDLAALRLSAYTIKNIAGPDLNLGKAKQVRVEPSNDGDVGEVQHEVTIVPAGPSFKVIDLFESDLTRSDKLIYVNDVMKGTLVKLKKVKAMLNKPRFRKRSRHWRLLQLPGVLRPIED